MGSMKSDNNKHLIILALITLAAIRLSVFHNIWNLLNLTKTDNINIDHIKLNTKSGSIINIEDVSFLEETEIAKKF